MAERSNAPALRQFFSFLRKRKVLRSQKKKAVIKIIEKGLASKQVSERKRRFDSGFPRKDYIPIFKQFTETRIYYNALNQAIFFKK
jgi:hypothetical protein